MAESSIKKPNRTRSAKVRVWMKPELVSKVTQAAYDNGLSRDGAFEEGMNLWVSMKGKL